MKQLNLFTIIIALFAIQTLTAQPDWQLAYAFGSEDTGAERNGLEDIATDTEGNYYIGGWYDGPLIMGPVVIEDEDDVGFEVYTGLLIKCNSSGQYQWHRQIYSDNAEYFLWEAVVTGIATDSNNDVYITGFFCGTVILSDEISITSTGTFTKSMFVIKFSGTDGTVLWADESAGTDKSEGNQLVTDAENNVYVTGDFQGTADFSGTELTTAGGYDVFVAKYNSEGSFQWVTQTGDTDDDFCSSIATDNNNIFVIGRFNGTPTIGTTTLVNGTSDMFVAKCNSEGAWQNATSFYSSSEYFGYNNYTGDIDCDDAGNVFITGPFNTDIDFGSGAENYSNHPGYVAKYDNALSLEWYNIIESDEDQGSYQPPNGAFALATDADNNIIVIGAFYGTIDFGSGVTITENSFSRGAPYIAKYNNTGEIEYAEAFNCQENYGGAIGIAIDTYENKLFVAGELENSISVGGFLLIPSGWINMFVASDFALPSSANDILSFTLAEQSGNADINIVNHTVEIKVVSGTNISNLTPSITISDFASISPESGIPQDFTNPVEYTVTAENNDEQIWTVTVDIETGILNSVINHFSVYPNPSNGILYFNFKELERPLRVEITNLTGKTIYTRRHVPLDNPLQIDLSNQPKGIYFIKIETENGTYTEKLIVQ